MENYGQGRTFFYENTKMIVKEVDIESLVDKKTLNHRIAALAPTDSRDFIRGVSHEILTFLDDCIEDGLFNLIP